MKQYILALVLAVVSASVAFAVNPIKEGNMISGHVIVKGTEENIPYATVLIIGSGHTLSLPDFPSGHRAFVGILLFRGGCV